MGTRSNTVVIDTGNTKPVKLINMYRQFDGYPSGHGKELSDFLSKIRLVNGMSLNKSEGAIANGVGCLAAQIVAHFKTEPGGIYLENPTGKCDNDYTYIVRANTFASNEGITVEVRDFRSKLIFHGSCEAFANWIETYGE